MWGTYKRVLIKYPRKIRKRIVQYYCTRIHLIRKIPYKVKSPKKSAYPILSGVLELGEKIVPCLIDNLKNLTPMPDPYCPKSRAEITVGDMSLFLLNRITDRRLKNVLPEHISKDMKKNGMHPYYNYVEKAENRKIIQANWRQWAATSHLN
jgi:hypothetical protein